LPGGKLIDRLQKIAGNVANRQYLKSRRLRQRSNGPVRLTGSYPKINPSPLSPAIIAATVVIGLLIFIFFVHPLTSSTGTAGRSFKKSLKFFGNTGLAVCSPQRIRPPWRMRFADFFFADCEIAGQCTPSPQFVFAIGIESGCGPTKIVESFRFSVRLL
jgi:hypothetical protein